jgi:hypothetical protein
MPISSTYTAVSVTVPQGVATQLYPLILAVDPSAAKRCREFVIQVDDSSPSVAYLGAANVSSSNYGAKLAVGGSETVRAGEHNEHVSVTQYYAYAPTTGGAKLNIQLIRG